MPHIVIKMLEGRSEPVKSLCVSKIAQAVQETIGAPDQYISVSVEEYSPKQWQDVFKNEIDQNPNLRKKPNYKPEELL